MPPLPLIVDLFLYAVLPPFAVAVVVMAVITFFCGSKQSPLAAALALGAAAALGFWLCGTVSLVPGDSAWNRLPWAALATLWIGRVARLPQLSTCAGSLLRAAAAFLVAILVIPLELRHNADWLAPAFATLVYTQWALLEKLATELPGGNIPICLALVFLGAGAILVHAGSALLMNVAVVMAAALAGIAIAAWKFRVDSGGVVPATAVLAPGVLLLGQQETFSEIPWQVFTLPAIAPLVLAEALPLTSWQTGRPTLLRTVLVLFLILVPLAVAVLWSHSVAPLEFDGF